MIMSTNCLNFFLSEQGLRELTRAHFPWGKITRANFCWGSFGFPQLQSSRYASLSRDTHKAEFKVERFYRISALCFLPSRSVPRLSCHFWLVLQVKICKSPVMNIPRSLRPCSWSNWPLLRWIFFWFASPFVWSQKLSLRKHKKSSTKAWKISIEEKQFFAGVKREGLVCGWRWGSTWIEFNGTWMDFHYVFVSTMLLFGFCSPLIVLNWVWPAFWLLLLLKPNRWIDPK